MFENCLAEPALKLIDIFNDELTRLNFYLASGGGLALQLGHRRSEDLDFFTPEKFLPGELAHYLGGKFHYRENHISAGTLYCEINAIKVSFIHYPVPLTLPLLKLKKISVADWRDIMAEKFKTLSQRGSRKDFYDIYACFVIKQLTIEQGVGFLKNRFAGTDINYYHILKSLVYFEDADKEPEIATLLPFNWNEVKGFFIKNIPEFEKYLLT
ncbi:MAG: hypothetical protein ABIK42_06940 [candidate division WOR-3 bacterium]